MSTWYVAKARYSTKVDPVEVERFTDNSVWIKGHRKARRSDYKNYFPSRLEALVFLQGRFLRKIEFAKADLQNARSALGQVEVELTRLKQ